MKIGLSALPLAFLCAIAFGGEPANDAPRPKLDVPYAAVPPAGDADPEDKAWAEAAVIPTLQPAYNLPDPKPTAPATEVRVLWHEEALHVRFLCTDTDIHAPHAGRDENLYEGDVAEIFLDAKGDGLALCEFEFSPNGAIMDVITLCTGKPAVLPTLALDWGFYAKEVWHCREWNLDGIAAAAAELTDKGATSGWIVDAKLPAKGLLKRLGREKFEAGQEIRINFIRYDWPKGKDGKRSHLPLDWAPTLGGCPHISAAALGTIRLTKEKAPAKPGPAN